MSPVPTVPSPPADHHGQGGRVVVLGATGYVGARLVPRLAAAGHEVVCISRSAEDIACWEWGDRVDVLELDLQDDGLASHLCVGDIIVYLVHSMIGGEDFSAVDLAIAQNVARAAGTVEASRIVYLSGLGADDDLSDHLASRQAVGEALAAGPTPVTELQAALLLGSGSASFEMLRSIAELSPILPVPNAVTNTRCQPISIEDALRDIEWAIVADKAHGIVHIGGKEVLTYGEIIQTYGRVAGLHERRLVSIPFVPNALSAFVLNLIAPLPRRLVRHLVGSLDHDVIVQDAKSIDDLRPDRSPADVEDAIRAAIEADTLPDVGSHWSDDIARTAPAALLPADEDWAGQTIFTDERTIESMASADEIFASVASIGGRRGWLVTPFLWELRGVLDRLTPGGVGLRRGRRHPRSLRVGDIIDWWRVEALTRGEHLLLRAEMRVPGSAWLEWTITDDGDARTVAQRAVFVPEGLTGRLYWGALLPFHGFLFPRLLRRIVPRADGASSTHDTDADLRDLRELAEPAT